MTDSTMNQQLLETTYKLGKSSEETTKTVQKIKSINTSLVDITQRQYDVVNQVSLDGEHIKSILSDSVLQADSSLNVLNTTVHDMGNEFSRIEESIHLFDNIIDSTQSLNKVARFTKMLALNTSVLGGSLGKEGAGINNVAYEMQELVKVCEEASSHIEEVVVSTRKNLKQIIDLNKQHLEKSLDNTQTVEQSLSVLIGIVTGQDEPDSKQVSVDSILSSVSSLGAIAQEVSRIAENTRSETDTLNNEVEVSNQAVSDLVGIVTNTPITNMSPEQAFEHLGQFRVIDVRRIDEFNDALGHIHSAKLCTINEQFKDKLTCLNQAKNYLFVCRSGGRSSRAARVAQSLGFPHIFNLEGGMLAWDKCGLPVARN